MESIQVLLLLLAAFALCCDATSEPQHPHPAPPQGARWKEQLLGQLLEGYDTDVEPPLTSAQLNTTVNVSLSVICASSLYGDHSAIEGWFIMMWKDARLSWDPSSYGEVKSLHVSASRIWKPDLRLFTGGYVHFSDVLAVVHYDGSVVWVPPVDLFMPCQDSHNDTTSCDFRFGSWTYAGDIIDVRLLSSGLWLDAYNEACPTIVQSHEAKRNVNYYECCEEPYIDIAISLQLAWRHSR